MDYVILMWIVFAITAHLPNSYHQLLEKITKDVMFGDDRSLNCDRCRFLLKESWEDVFKITFMITQVFVSLYSWKIHTVSLMKSSAENNNNF